MSELVLILNDKLHIVMFESKEGQYFLIIYNQYFYECSGTKIDYCCKWGIGARNVKLIRFKNCNYIMSSENLGNYAWTYVHEDDWNQDGVLLETWFLVIYDTLIHCLEKVL